MTVKISDMIAFTDFYNAIKDQNFSFQTAYKLSKINKEVIDARDFFNNELTKLIQTYGARDDNNELIYVNGNIKINEDLIEECSGKINELENTETTIDLTFTMDEFNNVSVSPELMKGVIPFIQ